MRIEQVRATAFGPLVNQVLTFAPGMTVIHGPNEAGKSAWFAATYAALAGRRKAKGRGTLAQRDFARRHKPWTGSRWAVGGSFVLADGTTLVTEHNLRTGETSLMDSQTRSSMTVSALERRLGMELITEGGFDGARLIGLNRDALRAIAFVAQADVLRVVEDAAELQHLIERAASSITVDVTADGALEALRALRAERVGVEHVGSRPLRVARQRLEAAKRNVDHARDQHREWVSAREQEMRASRDLDSARRALAAAEQAFAWTEVRAERDRVGVAARLASKLEQTGEIEAVDEAHVARVREGLAVYESRGSEPTAVEGESADALRAMIAELPEPPTGDVKARDAVLSAHRALLAAGTAIETHDANAPAPSPVVEIEAEPNQIRALASALEEETAADDPALAARLDELRAGHAAEVARYEEAITAYQADAAAFEAQNASAKEVETAYQEKLSDYRVAFASYEASVASAKAADEAYQQQLLQHQSQMAAYDAHAATVRSAEADYREQLAKHDDHVALINHEQAKYQTLLAEYNAALGTFHAKEREHEEAARRLDTQRVEAAEHDRVRAAGSARATALMGGGGAIIVAALIMAVLGLVVPAVAVGVVGLGLAGGGVVKRSRASGPGRAAITSTLPPRPTPPTAPVIPDTTQPTPPVPPVIRELAEPVPPTAPEVRELSPPVPPTAPVINELSEPVTPVAPVAPAEIASLETRLKVASEQAQSAREQRVATEEACRALGLPTNAVELRRIAREVEDSSAATERSTQHAERRDTLANTQVSALERLDRELVEAGEPSSLSGSSSTDHEVANVLRGFVKYEHNCRSRAEQAQRAARRGDLESRLHERVEAEESAARALEVMREREAVVLTLAGELTDKLGPVTDHSGAAALLRAWLTDSTAARSASEERQQLEAKLEQALDGRDLVAWRAEVDERAEALGEDPGATVTEHEVVHRREVVGRLTETVGNLRGTAGAIAESVPDLAASMEEESAAERELERVLALRQCLDIASEELEKAKAESQRTVAPALEERMRRWVPRVTNGRYVDVTIDPATLGMVARDARGGTSDAQLLSHGTTEQLYVLLRLALSEHLVRKDEPVPFVLDDITVQSDASRTLAILDMLHHVSRERQIILFTQEQEVIDWAQERLVCADDRVIALPSV